MKKKVDEQQTMTPVDAPVSAGEADPALTAASNPSESIVATDALTDATEPLSPEAVAVPSVLDTGEDVTSSLMTDVATEESPDASSEGAVPFAPSEATAEENVPAADEEALKKMVERRESRRKRRKRAKRMRMFHALEGKDIRYRGPLSYRGLRIAAWIAIILWQIGLWLSLGARMDAGYAEMVGAWPTVLTACRSLMTPLFLMATFALILNNSRRFRSLLCLYGGFSLLVIGLFFLLHDRYVVGLLMGALGMTRAEAVDTIQLFVSLLSKNGSFNFNIFIDLFLCTLFTCFVIYRPKRVFVGKRLIIFRLFALLPAAYEVASIVVKALGSFGTIIVPTYVFPFLTTKPPMTFLLFVVLTFFIKRREWIFRRNGKTHEEYTQFLGTNLNSLHFSTFVAIQFVVFAILDLLMLVILSFAVVGQFSYMEEPFAAAVKAVSSWGFGECLALIFVIPFILLFSYTRTHKDGRLDIIIHIVGIFVLVLVHIEALYQGLLMELDTLKGMLGL